MLNTWLASAVIFSIGMYGLLVNRRSVIHILISLELMYLALSLSIILYSNIYQNYVGQIIPLVILASVAAEAAIGLSLLVFRFNVRSTISVESLSLLCG